MDQDEGRTAVMYRIILEDIRIAVVGHIHPNLTDDELESLGTIDILFVPVGGNGYTLDGVGAHKVIKDIEPKIVIPTHYADPKINYEVPQTDLEEALKGVGIEASERLDSLKIKDIEPTDTTKLIVLNRQ
jgi:L-ascorbate metabolism protein UlaG (beta-lactamase superfamily)